MQNNISKTLNIYPNNYIGDNVSIGDNTIIYPGNFLENCSIGNNCIIRSSTITDSVVKNNVTVGPNAHIRNGSVIEDNVRIGNFVEVKKSTIGNGSKVAHLTYIGDAEIGKCCNIGCGVICCNYDGVNKHRTIIKDNVFVGSNVNLIAPIVIEENSFIAAGSTITKDVDKNTFAIARAKQENKPKR